MVKSILIVEDNLGNLELLKDIFEPRGYNTIGVVNGQDALNIISDNPPDLVIMDIQLPGMDGYTVTKKIKQNPKTNKIPVIAITAYALREDREKALNAGCDEYMSKPIDTREIVTMVEKFIGPSD
jgi:CheY-like chemotaxis protein